MTTSKRTKQGKSGAKAEKPRLNKETIKDLSTPGKAAGAVRGGRQRMDDATTPGYTCTCKTVQPC